MMWLACHQVLPPVLGETRCEERNPREETQE